jgi:1-acyl-sn-glycerol-3-phosphate acyltransferase
MKTSNVAISQISRGLGRFLDSTFEGVHISAPAIDAAELARRPLLVACTHRSQTDYFLLGKALLTLGIQNLRFAAGENLTTLPWLGRRFRLFGAFSIRRDKILGRDYVRRLSEMVVKMMRNGDTVIVFPEGGRSYRGGMMEIRGGIIGSAVVTHYREPHRGTTVLPASISYERLPELPYFSALERGRTLRRASRGALSRFVGTLLYFGADAVAFTKFFFAHKFGMRYGRVYVDIGKPLPVSEMVDVKAEAIEGARDDFSACRTATQIVGLRLFDCFESLYRILPVHVLAHVIQEHGALPTADAAARCRDLVRRLAAANRNVASVEGLDGETLVSEGVRQLKLMKAVKCRRGRVAARIPWIIRYYAATAA